METEQEKTFRLLKRVPYDEMFEHHWEFIIDPIVHRLSDYTKQKMEAELYERYGWTEYEFMTLYVPQQQKFRDDLDIVLQEELLEIHKRNHKPSRFFKWLADRFK